jgi:hypothetical protein
MSEENVEMTRAVLDAYNRGDLKAVLIVSPDFFGNATHTALENVSHVEWDSSATGCPPGRLQVETFVYQGDEADDDDGGGNTVGDDLAPDDEAFAFVVP